MPSRRPALRLGLSHDNFAFLHPENDVKDAPSSAPFEDSKPFTLSRARADTKTVHFNILSPFSPQKYESEALVLNNTSPQTQSPLFKLPLELRLQIYELALPGRELDLSEASIGNFSRRYWQSSDHGAGILFASKRTRLEGENVHWNNSNVIIRVNVHRVIWARTGPRQLSALRKLGLRIKHLTVEISASFGVEVRLPESKRVVEEILDAIDYGTRLKSFTMNIAGTLGVLSQNAIEALGYWKNLRVKGRVQISETLLGSPGGLSISKEIIHELEGAIKGHRKSIVRLERALSKCHVDDYFAPRPSDSSKEPKDYFSASHK